MKHKSSEQHFGLDFIATGKETNGLYFLSQSTIPKSDPGPPPHVHSHEDESFYLQKGNLTFYVNGKEILLTAGEFLHVKRGQKHHWKNEGNEDAELLVVFAPAGIEDMFRELDRNPGNIREIGEQYGTIFEL